MARILLAADNSRALFDLLGAAASVRALQPEIQIEVLIATAPDEWDEEQAAQFGTHGAQVIHLALDDRFAVENTEGMLQLLLQTCEERQPDWVLLPADAFGRNLAPRLAWRWQKGLITDVIAWTWNEGELQPIRPVFGGKALATTRWRTGSGIATIRPRSFDPPTVEPTASADVNHISLSVSPEASKIRSLGVHRPETRGVRLQDADLVISGGRGLGGSDGFELLEELAQLLNGAVGASRAAVDAGWIDPHRQVGQTGTVVAPNLYVAIGISGASQHLAGMSGSRHVVAINKDPDAPIFSVAELGVVEDYRKVVPELIRLLEAEQRAANA